MAIYELKCAIRSLKEYDVDYYMFDGSILGDLLNAYPKGAKMPLKLKENIDDSLLAEFQHRLDVRHYGLVFPSIRDDFKLVDLPKKENTNIVDETNLHLASIEKIILLNELFHWNIPDIAFLDKFTKKQGMSIIKYREVHQSAAFPFFNDFFKKLTFTVFYVRLQDNKNVLKVELPYKATKEEVFEIIRKINVLSVQGYPYLLNKAHNDVVITDRNMKELLKIAKIYETTNREVMSW